jgi:hypothetical protein
VSATRCTNQSGREVVGLWRRVQVSNSSCEVCAVHWKHNLIFAARSSLSFDASENSPIPIAQFQLDAQMVDVPFRLYKPVRKTHVRERLTLT